MSETSRPPTRPRSNSGRWLVVALFVLAGVIVGAFYATSYKFDPAPTAAAWGKPPQPIRVLSIDAGGVDGDVTALAAAINAAHADVILVQRFDGSRLDDFANRINLPQPGRVQIFFPAQNVLTNPAAMGNAIFSRFPLYEGRSIPNKGGSFGVWATAVAGDRKFLLASATLSTPPDRESAMLVRAWNELGSPPMIAGGAFAGAQWPDSVSASYGVLLFGGWELDSTGGTAADGVVECK